MLHTIEFTQSVGLVTAVMTFAIILSSSSLFKGSTCTETIHRGWITGTGWSVSWMWYFSPGKQSSLSKQSWYSSMTVGLDSWPHCAPVSVLVGEMVLTSSKFVDIIPRSWHCQASTTLNLILADLALKETFNVAMPRFSTSEHLYPLKMLLHGRIVIRNGKCWRSVVVITQASAPVSTFRLMSWRSLILTLA